MQEQRQNTRIGVGLKVKMRAEKYGFENQVTSVNISGGGIMLVIERRLPIGAQVDLEIILSPREHPIKTRGKIVWIKPVSVKNTEDEEAEVFFEKMYCGMEFIEFTDISPDDQSRLLNFIFNNISGEAVKIRT
ncbi:MAG: PilZ domain-containing protein [Candidatus Omnitrophota bacterium]